MPHCPLTPKQPSLVKERNPPKMDLSKQCNPQHLAVCMPSHWRYAPPCPCCYDCIAVSERAFSLHRGASELYLCCSGDPVHCNFTAQTATVLSSGSVLLQYSCVCGPRTSALARLPTVLLLLFLKKVHQYFARPLTWPAQLNNGILGTLNGLALLQRAD